MEKFYCVKKQKEVNIYCDIIPAPISDNPHNKTIGLINGCSEVGSRLCQDCPLIKK